MQFDPALVEAMARATREAWRDDCDIRDETSEWEDIERGERRDCVRDASAALAALCAARPDVAALLASPCAKEGSK